MPAELLQFNQPLLINLITRRKYSSGFRIKAVVALLESPSYSEELLFLLVFDSVDSKY